MANSEDMFWMVWAENGGSPTMQHRSEAAARAEAKRLATANPGSRFVVVQAIAGYKLVALEETVYDGIPF